MTLQCESPTCHLPSSPSSVVGEPMVLYSQLDTAVGSEDADLRLFDETGKCWTVKMKSIANNGSFTLEPPKFTNHLLSALGLRTHSEGGYSVRVTEGREGALNLKITFTATDRFTLTVCDEISLSPLRESSVVLSVMQYLGNYCLELQGLVVRKSLSLSLCVCPPSIHPIC
jgi:hypothetical protein